MLSLAHEEISFKVSLLVMEFHIDISYNRVTVLLFVCVIVRERERDLKTKLSSLLV